MWLKSLKKSFFTFLKHFCISAVYILLITWLIEKKCGFFESVYSIEYLRSKLFRAIENYMDVALFIFYCLVWWIYSLHRMLPNLILLHCKIMCRVTKHSFSFGKWVTRIFLYAHSVTKNYKQSSRNLSFQVQKLYSKKFRNSTDFCYSDGLMDN